MRAGAISKVMRAEILHQKGNRCFYCGGDARVLDHIIPYAYDPVNLSANLVPCCKLCNSIAGDKVFASFSAKRKYILGRRLDRADEVVRRHFHLPPRPKLPHILPDEKKKQKPVPIPEPGLGAIGRIQMKLLALSKADMPWSAVARRFGVSKGMAWRMAHGIEPANPQARRAFGLPPILGLTTQYQRVLYCIKRKCGKPFIANHPQRRRCFECSPVRKHK